MPHVHPTSSMQWRKRHWDGLRIRILNASLNGMVLDWALIITFPQCADSEKKHLLNPENNGLALVDSVLVAACLQQLVTGVLEFRTVILACRVLHPSPRIPVVVRRIWFLLPSKLPFVIIITRRPGSTSAVYRRGLRDFEEKHTMLRVTAPCMTWRPPPPCWNPRGEHSRRARSISDRSWPINQTAAEAAAPIAESAAAYGCIFLI